MQGPKSALRRPARLRRSLGISDFLRANTNAGSLIRYSLKRFSGSFAIVSIECRSSETIEGGLDQAMTAV